MTESNDGETSESGDGPVVRHGREGDLLAVLRILEGAMLTVGANQVRRRTESGEVLVAEVDGRVVGALVRDGDHVEAIAVHPQRRGAGIGTRLVEVALAETGHLTAEFRPAVRPFYERLGFTIEARAQADTGGRGETETERGTGAGTDTDTDTDEPRLWGERRA